MGIRERVVPLLPAPERPELPLGHTSAQKMQWKLEMLWWERTIDALLGLKSLHHGKLVEEIYSVPKWKITDPNWWRESRPGAYPNLRGPCPFLRSWDESPVQLQEIVNYIGEAVKRVYKELAPSRGEEALDLLDQAPTGSFSGRGALDHPEFFLPSRGDTTPMVIGHLSLPSGTKAPVRSAAISHRVARVFLDPQRRMLRSRSESQALLKGLKAY